MEFWRFLSIRDVIIFARPIGRQLKHHTGFYLQFSSAISSLTSLLTIFLQSRFHRWSFFTKSPLRKQRAADAGPTSDMRNGEEISNVTFKQTMVTFTLSHVMNLRHVGAICCLKKKSTWEAFKSNVNPASSSQWDYVRWWCVVLDAGRQFMFVDSSCKLTSATVALC